MPLRYDAGFDAPPLKTPILVSLFRAVGVVILLATAVATVVALKSGELLVDMPVAASGVLSSLLLFGIAEVILLVAKIEYNTAAQKDAAILQSLHKIESTAAE